MHQARSGAVVAVAWLAGLVPFALHSWFALRGYFAHDDWVFLQNAITKPFDLSYLFQNYNGHVAPGAFALVAFVTAIAPLNFAVAVLPLLLMQAATYFVLWRLLVRCFGRRWAILVPFGVFTCSPVIHTSTLWWAYALQLIPLLLAMVCALHAHVRFLQTGSTRSLVAGLLWTAFGMAFYEKAALIAPLLFGITLLFATADGLPARLGWAFRTYRRAWLAHGMLLAAYVALYASRATDPVRSRDVEISSVPELALRMIVDSLIVPSLGIPVEGSTTEGVAQVLSSHELIRIVAVLAVFGLVAFGVLLGRLRAALAWILLGGYLAADVALVALTRLPLVGPAIGTDLRYIADAVLIMTLCGAFAYLRPQIELETKPRRIRQPSSVRGHAGIAAAVLLVLVGATVNAVRLAPNMLFPTAREYLATADSALAARPGIVLYDSPVPERMMIGWFEDQRLASRVLATLPKPPKFDLPAEQMFILDDRGNPREISNVALAVTGVPGPVKRCGYPVTREPTTISLRQEVRGHQLMRISYITAASGKAAIKAGSTEAVVEFRQGVHRLYLVTSGTYRTITVARSSAVAAVCLDRIEIGTPVA